MDKPNVTGKEGLERCKHLIKVNKVSHLIRSKGGKVYKNTVPYLERRFLSLVDEYVDLQIRERDKKLFRQRAKRKLT